MIYDSYITSYFCYSTKPPQASDDYVIAKLGLATSSLSWSILEAEGLHLIPEPKRRVLNHYYYYFNGSYHKYLLMNLLYFS